MDRKWRFNRAGYDTVLSIADFTARIPPADAPNTLVTPTDLYAMYTLLHIDRKEWDLRWSTEGGFYYFLVQWQDMVREKVVKPAAIPAYTDAQELSGSEDALDDDHFGEYSGGDSEGASEPEDETSPGRATASAAEEEASAKPIEWYKRTQIVVPVSSSTRELTPMLLQRFFSVRGVEAQQLILAMIDANGVPTQNVLYNYIQAPLEGPGMANLELLDD